MVAAVSIQNIRKLFGRVEVVRGVSLDIKPGEFIVLVGPSGCGKSTTLRMVAGLDEISAGRITIDDRVINDLAPKDRDVAMVFQNYALYPHLSVFENICFGLRLKRTREEEVRRAVNEAAEILGLTALLDRKPSDLSGGQRQRVAMGRAIVRNPKVFLFDEPLSNLDAKLRNQMRAEIKRLHARLGTTVIYVTHDQVEAMTLADRIVVMNLGRIEQVGSPRDLYETPGNTFVATFIGSPRMTLLTVERDGNRLGLDGAGAVVSSRLPQGDDKAVILGARPDAFTLLPDGADGFSGRVVYTEYLGDNAFTYVRLGDGSLVSVRLAPDVHPEPDTAVRIGLVPERAHFFSRDTASRLPT
ncbi:sn-glycerol-3-phosphate ABC transporter ATP-binding protein UgpC [Mycobacterium tuberculosis]|nr:sn-glycerol-3-phosphate ABC transporter ATP-binding protein UgpC [Mycobacterium tuberculosis]